MGVINHLENKDNILRYMYVYRKVYIIRRNVNVFQKKKLILISFKGQFQYNLNVLYKYV